MRFGNFSMSGHSKNALRKALKPDDHKRWGIKEDDLPQLVQDVSERFHETNQTIENITTGHFRGKRVHISKSPYDTITIRRTSYLISKFLNTPQFDKDEEVRQIYNIITNEITDNKLNPNSGRLHVYRGDINEFFESCNFENIINRLEIDGLSSKTTIRHLRNIQQHLTQSGQIGLPRGLSISSSLSEHIIGDFDKTIKTTPSVMYYSRYVDDFIIMFYNTDIDIESLVKETLQRIGLELNTIKSKLLGYVGESIRFDYLGYSISLNPKDNLKISTKKIRRTKARIAIAFSDCAKTENYNLLVDRLSFLCGNTKIHKFGRKKPLRIGFRHQYSLCTQDAITGDLKTLDHFLKGILFSKRLKSSIKIRNNIPIIIWKQLVKISFNVNYFNKKSKYYSPSRMKQIQSAWKYAEI